MWKIPQITRTSSGVFLNHETICQGYAYAFKLLCDQAQIPCWIVTGYYGDEPHAWNYVWLDGAYYLVDVTWDDANGRASDSPWFLAGSSYAKNYRIEDNSAPGELAASSYFTAGTKQQAQRTDQQESRPARSLSRAANS